MSSCVSFDNEVLTVVNTPVDECSSFVVLSSDEYKTIIGVNTSDMSSFSFDSYSFVFMSLIVFAVFFSVGYKVSK